MRTWDAPPGAALFDTPEEAALAQWQGTTGVDVSVIGTRPSTDDGAVWVAIQIGEPTGFHDQDVVTCLITREGRWWAGGSTGSSSQ